MHPLKRSKLDHEPDCLREYREAHNEASWQEFRNAGRTCYDTILHALWADQYGLCAYCEMDLNETDHQIEHFFPKSHSREGHCPALEIDNFLLCCKGGTNTVTESRQREGRCRKPLKDNCSCGQTKGETVLPDYLNPYAWSLPLIRTEIIPWGNLAYEEKDNLVYLVKMIPWEEHCQTYGIAIAEMHNFIDILNLNCMRLQEQRGIFYKELLDASEAVPDNDIMNFVCWYILPQAGTLHRFFTTARLFFSAKAEEVLREPA